MSWVKEARLSKGYKQKELADKIRVSVNTIINWEGEKSSPPYNKMQEISVICEHPLPVSEGVNEACDFMHKLSAEEKRRALDVLKAMFKKD